MKNIFKSISSTLKLCGLIFLIMTGLQSLSAQIVCHNPGTISINLGESGAHLVDGSEVVISTNGATITDITLRLDGMNGPITPNPLTCGLLLGGPRTIWVMVETDDGNNCMTSVTLQDKMGPALTCPTVVLDCDDPFSSAAPATAADNCSNAGNVSLTMNQSFPTSTTGFSDAFSLASATTNADPAVGGRVGVDATSTVMNIVRNGYGGGLADCSNLDGDCAVLEVCYTIPATGSLSFTWSRTPLVGEPSSTNFPGADPFGYSIDAVPTVLSTQFSGNEVGTSIVAVNSGETFCFLLGSNRVGPSFRAGVSDLVYTIDPANSCDNDYIVKRWTATDEYGNSNSCLQFITKDITDEITCPDSLLTSLGTAISCTDFDSPNFAKDSNGHPAVSETGEPTGCNINYTYTDIVIEGCMSPNVGGCRKINRTFHIVNSCTGTKTTCVQQIQIEDTDGPVLSGLSDNFVVPTDATDCIASYVVPAPSITDNCSSFGDYTVSSSAGTISNNGTNFVIENLPLGPFTVTYQVRDCCGNLTTETYNGDVQDLAPPTPVCESFRDISLTSDGTGRIFASSFDDGSHDNCNPVFFKVLRMDETGCPNQNGDDNLTMTGNQIYFDDDVYFCCEDLAAGSVQVILRVFDVNPGAGPVDARRMNPNSSLGDLVGHFNDCMVTVNVFDKVAPTISCPSNATVSCEFWFDINDLSATFGTVVSDPTAPATTTTLDPGTGLNVVITDGVAAGNCTLTPEEINVTDLRNSCGLGTILRTFSVGTGSQQRTCTQIINVVDASPFNLSNISWPAAEVNFTDCMAATDTSVTGKPTITGDGVCAQVSVTFSDEDFPVEPNSCFKVKRSWTVKDICQHNPSDPTEGVWTFDQIISVKNNMDPTYASCEPVDAACGGTVNLSQTVNDDCTPLADLRVDFKIDVDNNGTFEYVGGNNNPTAGSGMTVAASSYNATTGEITVDPLALPDGTHRILWATEDLCSNVGTCTQIITIGSDNEAPQLDINSITVSNQSNTVSGFITAFDNCQDAADLTYSWDVILGTGVTSASALSGTGNTLTTIDYVGAGIITVQFTVSDGVNSAMLVNQDFNVSGPGTAMIAGAISMDDGEMVENVHVDAGIGQTDMTDQNGEYVFVPVETNQDYAVEPTKNDDPRNGITTIDIVMLARHIIGIQPLTTPYKIIAADITNDQTINVFDMLELQRLLIWDIPEFTNNNSWRFVDATWVFQDPTNPFTIPFPESYDINGLTNDMMGVDFTAVKIGDINGDVVANANQEAVQRNDAATYAINVADQTVAKNGTTTIAFSASEATEINGLQLVLDLGQLNVTAVNAAALEFGDNEVTLVNGQYVISYASGVPVEVAANEVLFTLEVTAEKTTSIATELQVQNNLLNAEVYTGKDQIEINNAAITVESADQVADVLFQNRPNPFTQNTTIGFYLVEGGAASITIYDVAGKLIHNVDGNFEAGYNQIDISAADISVGGVLYYQLATDKYTASRRMTILK